MVNSISSIVKLLEEPRKKRSGQNISPMEVRAQFPPARNNNSQIFAKLIFWGELSEGVLNYYKPNDYLIIEGYVSLKTKQTTTSFIPHIEITVLKVYPFLLTLNLDRY